MAYTVIRTIYRLVFPERDGMEVRAKAVSIDELLEVTERASGFADVDLANVTPAVAADMRGLFDQFGRYLIDWNLETEEGEPIECSGAGLRSLEPELAFEIIFAWQEAASSISLPKDASLPGGSPSLEASIPMAALSESRAS